MKIEELKERILKLDVASICDAHKEIRIMDPGIKPIRAGSKLFGVAHTATCKDDFLTVIKALRDASVGEVLVVDTGNTIRAVAGELFSTEAQRRGLSGIVVDGAVRDSPKIRETGLPVYSRYINPMAGTANKIFTTQESITCGGITVRPGEILFGDDEGVIVSTVAELSELVPIAEEIERKEEKVLAKMAQGESLLTALNFDEHFEKCRCGEESKLKLG